MWSILTSSSNYLCSSAKIYFSLFLSSIHRCAYSQLNRIIQKRIIITSRKQLLFFLFRNSDMFRSFMTIIEPSVQYFKIRYNTIHTYSPYGCCAVWDHTSLQCPLQYKIVKSGHIAAEGCKIIVGL